jgi:hypothetical protein
MRKDVVVDVSAADRVRPVVADRNNLQKHGWRAQIVLLIC